MNDLHVDPDLSAYLDDELSPADRARVEAHLAGCQRCARRLAELRSTASLIGALPAPRPARSLVPPLGSRWNWLRPVRSLSAIASGAFLFLFVATAVAQTGSTLGGGDLAPFGGTGAAPAAAPAPQEAAASAPTEPQKAVVGATSAPRDDQAAPSADLAARTTNYQPPQPVSPFLWLGLAVLTAAAAVAAHRRLRAVPAVPDRMR